MYLTHLECTECERREDPARRATICHDCSAPWVARYDLAAVAKSVSRELFRTRPEGLWRYREVLPLSGSAAPVTLGEGGTPLLELPRLGAEFRLQWLRLKDEGQNPTGSFKARGMSVAVSMAREQGARHLAAPSAGNAGGALAAYGARAGLPVTIAMPEDVPVANRIEAETCGAHVKLLPGTIADCGRWIAEEAQVNDWFDLSTLKEPYRVEGKKTMAYELAEQLDWSLPDVILYPTGGGTGLVGMAKAFAEMATLGWIDPSRPSPRLVAVQAEGCAPIVTAFHSGGARGEFPPAPHTVASGLRVPTPIGDRWMLRELRTSGGTAVAISDEELIAGSRQLARSEGIFCAPEGGALVAALEKLRSRNAIQPHDRVVIFNTGTGLKYLECFGMD